MWPVEVFVPTWAAAPVVARLRELGALVTVCPRMAADPPGDPCVHRFREAVAAGAIPFAVQGPENALCLDTGRSIGFEVIEAMGHFIDRVFVQVGGGALATCLALAAADEGIHPSLHTVQTQGCAPLERAWRRAQSLGVGAAPRRWDECMWPWETEPHSAADGILDDETYDWVGAVQGMAASGGAPVVVTEAQVLEAHELGRRLTGIDVSATGTAGLAGLLAIRDQVADDERVVVLFTGRERGEGSAGGAVASTPMSDLVVPPIRGFEGAGTDNRMEVYNRLLRNRIVVLGTDVNDDVANLLVAQLLYLDAEDPTKDIWLYINSPGGSVTAGMAIYDTMQFLTCDVATICMGLAASMGQFLLCAGAAGKRYSLPHARIMMHQPLGGLRGQAADIAIQAEQMAFTKRLLAERIAHHTGQTAEQVITDSDRDRWFSAEQAKDYGMIDHVIVKRGEIR